MSKGYNVIAEDLDLEFAVIATTEKTPLHRSLVVV